MSKKALISSIRVKSNLGYEQHEVYNIDTFPYEYFEFKHFDIYKKWKNKTVYEYYNIIACFDTENTSYYIPETDHWEAFTWIWGFCIDGFLIVGRTYEQFNIFIERLHNVLKLGKRKLIIYVHNLSYDFSFIWRFLAAKDENFSLFATDTRKILTFNAYGFEFRCSYRLFNMSLDKALKNEKGTKYRKAKGDISYKKFRLPTDGLTKKEWNYFIMDLLGLSDLIYNKLINEGKSLKNIPLTSTGFIRELSRNACIGYGTSKKTAAQKEYIKDFKKLELQEEVYYMLEWAIAGGDTHGNRKYIGVRVPNCDGGDLQSSYPAEELLNTEYPISSYILYGEVENEEVLRRLMKEYSCLFFITFKHIEIKEDNPFDCISVSKIVNKDSEVLIMDNGRLISGNNIKLSINHIDFELIERNYDFDEYKISNFYIAEKGPLPEAYRQVILELFKGKCKLKIEKEKNPHDEDIAYRYNKYKNLINATFGCMLTNPVRPQIKLNNEGEWEVTTPDVKEELEKYYSNRKTFLHYAWGMIVTSGARLSLDNMRRACIGKTGEALYWDTDSCKGFDFDFKSIEKFNKKQREKCVKAGCLVTVDDREFVIGDIDIETKNNPYKEFVTMGAKKYAYTDNEGLHITVAGVKKKEGAKELGNIKRFKEGFIFKNAGQTACYNDDDIHYITLKGKKILTASNVALYDTTYTLNAPDDWLSFTIGGDLCFE